jgi:hypothetical protein
LQHQVSGHRLFDGQRLGIGTSQSKAITVFG